MIVVSSGQAQPERLREEAQRSLVHWGEALRAIGDLLPLPVEQVTLEDKRVLITELKTIVMMVTACVNALQTSEIEAKAMVAKMQEKWGWLL